MNLLGLDLAWKPDKNSSALAIWQNRRLTLYESVLGQSRIGQLVIDHAEPESMLAVDAPLIASNQSGQRPCERGLNERFRKHGAGAHPFHLGLYPEAASLALAQEWRQHGFQWALPAHKKRAGRWLAEVYPHPAQITLLGQSKIIRYKKGSVAERRQRLDQFRAELHAGIARLFPALAEDAVWQELRARDLSTLRGDSLKHYEDSLDAVFCLLIAQRLATLPSSAVSCFGEEETGFILVPES